MKQPAPYRLLYAMDQALQKGEKLPSDHIRGVLEWLHSVLVHNVEHTIAFTQDEVVLIASALSDALAEPIHEVPRSPGPAYEEQKRYDTIYLTEPERSEDEISALTYDAMTEVHKALRARGFLEAVCCDKSAAMVNPDVEVGYYTLSACRNCGCSFVVDVVDGNKVLRRKEDA